MSEPEKIVAGTTAEWTVPAGDYDASTWTLSYSLLSKDKNRITITSSDDGNGDHSVALTAATTGAYTEGEYFWQRFVTDGSDTHMTGQGRLTVAPNYTSASIDPRSSAQKALDALTAVREGKASGDQLTFAIQGRSISRMSWDEINAAWSHFKKLVDAEIAEEKDDLGVEDESNTTKVAFYNA